MPKRMRQSIDAELRLEFTCTYLRHVWGNLNFSFSSVAFGNVNLTSCGIYGTCGLSLLELMNEKRDLKRRWNEIFIYKSF